MALGVLLFLSSIIDKEVTMLILNDPSLVDRIPDSAIREIV
ncbi:hypothetical protein NMYAN_90095 [Nitrosomonas nitrosa]|uniref:Uncharacterized protein n=1 Tax=Nitrosomonas nitrosa TaxID=52442 RepID=A0A8H8Z3C1_9PROT|nr:hypothetical protein NMYAN_90095 [Nitrosomonas nitrosa]